MGGSLLSFLKVCLEVRDTEHCGQVVSILMCILEVHSENLHLEIVYAE
jgi:hypothetical protein